MARTLEEIRKMGLAALRQHLGRAGMIRFLQQFETGGGDYARERHAWVDTVSLDALSRLAHQGRKKKRTRRT